MAGPEISREAQERLVIEELDRPFAEADLRDLALLLADAVASGASVSFLAPFSTDRALEWWREAEAKAAPRAIFLAARDARGIVGTVQLQPAWAPNQPHRAEVAKLIVHRRARRKGIGATLLAAIEQRARIAGFTLLTLDTTVGDPAEALYRKAGWIAVGIVPGYSLTPDGSPTDVVFFYKIVGG